MTKRTARKRSTVKPSRVDANAIQHGGNHYKDMRIEPWDYISANEIGFLDGNAIRYLSRWKSKNGIEDLKKAAHFVQKLIEVEEAKIAYAKFLGGVES